MSEAIPSQSELLHKALFVPCESKADLRDWFECYLGLDFPDTIVSHDSNSSPMDTLWTVYDAFRCRRFNLPDKAKYVELKEIMAYASRDSFKTLGVSALEVVVLLHMSLSVAHMAAIERQAKKAQQYVKDFFQKEHLRKFVTIQNETRIEVTRYSHRISGLDITKDEFEVLSPPEQAEYDRKWNYIAIVICTMAGANSEHVPFMVVDEVDVIPKQNMRAYEEAKLIPSPWQGVQPITLYTSTRKFSFGLVQAELDAAHETGLIDFHWNIIDVTEPCPPERHLPNEPRIPIYFADPQGQTKGRAVSEEEWTALPDEKKTAYHRAEGYSGCLKNCKLFFACKGALATKQTSKSKLLKEIDHTISQFRKVSPGMANAQLLCKKPSEEGLIYPHLDRSVHMLTAAQMAEKITGDPYPATLTKFQLLDIMRERDTEFGSGIDHGHAHNFAVVTGAKDGRRFFVIDVQSVAELELDHKIMLLETVLKQGFKINPRIWPDTNEPGSNKTIKRKGFRVQEWTKGAGSVVSGIEVVRSKIYPAVGEPELFFLADDPGCELLFARLSKYHWTLDEAGRPTDIPDEHISKDVLDDECDALRYVVMNEFKPKGKIQAPKDSPRAELSAPSQVPTVQNYLTHYIQEHLGQKPGEEPVVTSGNRGRQGNFLWDM